MRVKLMVEACTYRAIGDVEGRNELEGAGKGKGKEEPRWEVGQ